MADRKQRKKRRSNTARRKIRRLVARPGGPPGSMPGTLNVDPEAEPPVIQVIAYGPDGVEESPISEVSEIPTYLERWPVVWINVDGLGSEQTIRELGDLFGLHRLVLEDIVHTGQRAKMEPFAEHLYVVARQPRGDGVETEQLSLVLSPGSVLTFQEHAGDVFDPVRERIRTGAGQIRFRKADYLAYALIDATIDGYFPVLERLGERIEEIEEEVFTRPDRGTMEEIHEVRRDLLQLRKAAWPHREKVNSLIRDSEGRIDPETTVYLRDTYDHAIRIVDLIETMRELTADLMNGYMSSVSNRMNEVMKVLTIMASIFIPLSFIAGVYGMNFDPAASRWNMPELGWELGYPFALALMAAVAIGLLVYFGRKGWMD
jgi:magnesium transporter